MKARQKDARVKPATKAGKKDAKKTTKKVETKKLSTQKKSLKQKKAPKIGPKKKVSAKKVVKKKAVASSGKNISKNKTKTLSKPSRKSATPAKTLKSPPKGIAGISKKPTAAVKTQKVVQPAQKPLDPVFAKIRVGLLASRTELFKMVESSQELERNVSELTFSNEIDLASSLEGREMVFQLASRDRNGLKLIDDALFKMAHGTYGICESCAKPIGIKRLQILPLTQFCIECQETMEHST